MYVIAVYDIGEKRVGKILKIFRKYLTRIQNSVFEGEITKSKFEKLKIEVLEVIDKGYDNVLYYKLTSDHYLRKEQLGVQLDQMSVFL